MFSKALLAATVVGAATAQVPAIAKREFLENRQLDGLTLGSDCSSALSAVSTLYASLPTPPADLASVTLPTDPCVTPSFTGTIQSEYASYTSSALQWYSSNSAELVSFLSACSTLVGDVGPTGLPVCTTSSGSARPTQYSVSPTITSSHAVSTGAASTGAASHSGTASHSGSPASTSAPSQGAASRETGFALAAAAAAGLMGAVVAL